MQSTQYWSYKSDHPISNSLLHFFSHKEIQRGFLRETLEFWSLDNQVTLIPSTSSTTHKYIKITDKMDQVYRCFWSTKQSNLSILNVGTINSHPQLITQTLPIVQINSEYDEKTRNVQVRMDFICITKKLLDKNIKRGFLFGYGVLVFVVVIIIVL